MLTASDDRTTVVVPKFSRITSQKDDLPRETTTSTTEDTGLWPLSSSSSWTPDTGLWGVTTSTTEETTLQPKVTSTENWPINSSDLSTMGTSTAEESIITEESTITNGVVTKTDSGQTVTVPNDEVVTVTRHTIIVTDKPPPLPTGTTFDTSAIPSSSLSSGEPAKTPEDGGREDADADGGGASLPAAALAGIGVGGFVIVGILILVGFGVRKRRQKNREHHDAARPSDYDRDQDLEEKHFPEHMTPHTTGTQADDPFAPFGGMFMRQCSKPANAAVTNCQHRSCRPPGRGLRRSPNSKPRVRDGRHNHRSRGVACYQPRSQPSTTTIGRRGPECKPCRPVRPKRPASEPQFAG